VEQHVHCLNCMEPIPTEKIFCSKSCENNYTKRHLRNMYVLRFLTVFLLLFVIVLSFEKVISWR
jgi:predicted nucleic acid-binding Zn ribbon protein